MSSATSSRATYTGVLECLRCTAQIGEADAYLGCPYCREEGRHVNALPVYDLSRCDVPGPAGPTPDPEQPGQFGYRALLPLASDSEVVSLGEGGTPLIPLRRLGADNGLSEVYLKDESRNPTWSYKDRLVAIAVSEAKSRGVERIVVSSSGNAGASAAAYAAAAGMECLVLTIASVPETIKVLMQSYTPHVVALNAPEDRWRLMRRLVTEQGWTPTSGFMDPPLGSNPFGVDGYKTIAYEVLADLGRAPDVVVVPAAYGDGLIGIHRGFEDLCLLGVIEKVPRIVAVDPMGAYERALIDGLETLVPERDSAAFSIVVTQATYQGVQALTRSGGAGVTVDRESEIMAAQQALARREGLFVEASSAVTVAALPTMVARGLIGASDETVVLIGTSTGLKDVASTAALMRDVPVIEPSMAALERALSRELVP